MLKKQSFEIASIYVPVKRAKSLDAEKVRMIAESILEQGQNTPFMVRVDGDRFVLVCPTSAPMGRFELIEQRRVSGSS